MKKTLFFLLCAEGAVLSFNVAASSALIPAIARDYNVAPFYAGKIIWLYMLPYGIAALFYGPLVRIFDIRRVEIVCFFLFCCATLAAAYSRTIHQLFCARFLTGVFGASVIPLALILIAHQKEAASRGRSVGVFFGATFIASLVGLALSAVVHWRLVFFIPACAGLLVWPFMYRLIPDTPIEAGRGKTSYLAALRQKNILGLFSYIFFVSVLYHGIQQWLSVYFSGRYAFPQACISMLITLTSFSGIIGEILGGFASDHWGRRATVSAGLILMIVSVFALTARLPVAFLAVVMVVWGLGWTFNHAGLSTLLTDLPKAFLNEAASLNSGVRFISGGLGAALAGFLMQKSFILGLSVFGVFFILLSIGGKKFLPDNYSLPEGTGIFGKEGQ